MLDLHDNENILHQANNLKERVINMNQFSQIPSVKKLETDIILSKNDKVTEIDKSKITIAPVAQLYSEENIEEN